MKEYRIQALPQWVPDCALHYLAHTEAGYSIRDLARLAKCHASTVLRQIRRIESRRDDPLVDAALAALAAVHFAPESSGMKRLKNSGARPKENLLMTADANCETDNPDAMTLEQEAVRVLRRLCEVGAVMAVAEDLEKAVVVRDGKDGSSTRTAVVDRSVAQAMVLKDWISCANPGRISRYRITSTGRSALGGMLAEQENHARQQMEHGFAEAPAAFQPQPGLYAEKTVEDPVSGRPRRTRYNMAESPLTALARRKDRDGKRFLQDDLVRAGERLREDFELAQMGPRVAQNWDRFLTGGGRGGFAPDSGVGNGPSGARDRVARALSDLGPGLSDVALRCCCYLEGLEMAEKRMGWSARSGKIVLRIALQRLRVHYDNLTGPDRMIG